MIYNDVKLLQNSEIGAYLRDFRLIGQGGFGVVYQAHHCVLNRKVAIKIMRTGLESTDDSTVATRFLREARALSQLDHPNIAKIYAFGHTEGQPFIVLEYLEGKTLTDILIAEGPLSLERTKSMFSGIAGAVSEIHGHKLIHRDLSANNCMVVTNDDGSETVKVFDFGLVKDISFSDSQKLTRTQEVCGTLQYMSPEGCSGKSLDERSDIYSLGCLLYQMFSGKAPFSEPALETLMWKQVHEFAAPAYVARDDEVVYPELERALETALAKNSADRYQSVKEFNEAVQKVHVAKPAASYRRANAKATQLKSKGKMLAVVVAASAAITVVLCFHFAVNFKSAPDTSSEVNQLQLKLERLENLTAADEHALRLQLARAKTRLARASGTTMSTSEAASAWENVLKTCNSPDELITIVAESDSLNNVETKQLQRMHAAIKSCWQRALKVPLAAKSLISARLQCRDIVDAQGPNSTEANASIDSANTASESIWLSLCTMAHTSGHLDHAWLPYAQFLQISRERKVELERKMLRNWIQLCLENHRLPENKPLFLRMAQLSVGDPTVGSIDHLVTLSMLSCWPYDAAYSSRFSRECADLIKTRKYPDSSKLAEVLENLGTNAIGQHDYPNAKSYLERSRNIFIAVGDTHSGAYGNVENVYSHLLSMLGRPQEAVQAAERAASAYESVRHNRLSVSVLLETADQLPAAGVHERERLLNLALSYAAKEKKPKQRTESFAKIARALACLSPPATNTNLPKVLSALQKYADRFKGQKENIAAGPLIVRQADILNGQKKFQPAHKTVTDWLKVVGSSPVLEWQTIDRAYSALACTGLVFKDISKVKDNVESQLRKVMGDDQESRNRRACLHALLGYAEQHQKNYQSSTEHFRKAILSYSPLDTIDLKALALWQSNFLMSAKGVRTPAETSAKPMIFSVRELTAQFDVLQQLCADYDRDGLVDAQQLVKTRIADVIGEIARTDKNRAASLYMELANSCSDVELFDDAERYYDRGLALVANEVSDTRKMLLFHAIGSRTYAYRFDSKFRKLVSEAQSLLVLDAARTRPADLILAIAIETNLGLGQVAPAAEIAQRLEALVPKVTDQTLQREFRKTIGISKVMFAESDAANWLEDGAPELSLLYTRDGKIDKAIALTKKLLAMNKESVSPNQLSLGLMGLGYSYILDLKPAEAERSYREAAEVFAAHPNLVLGRNRSETYRLMGYALTQDKAHYQRVLEYLEIEQAAGKLKPLYLQRIALAQANYARLRGQVAEATSRYNRLLSSLTPTPPYAQDVLQSTLVGLGLCELSNKNLSTSEARFRQALDISRRPAPPLDSLNSASTFLGLADLSLQRNEAKEAIKFLKQARDAYSHSSPLGRQLLARLLNGCATHAKDISDLSQQAAIRKSLTEFDMPISRVTASI
jgi:serine/threonine protein kinase